MPRNYYKFAEFLYNRYGFEIGNEIVVKGNVENLSKLYV